MPALRTASYAARYRAARAYADLSQEELAEKLGVEVQTIKRRESGKQEPKTAELIAVASICGVPQEFMEHGWGVAGRDELGELVAMQNHLLASQSDAIDEIRTLLATQQAAARRLDELTAGALGALPELPPGQPDTSPDS